MKLGTKRKSLTKGDSKVSALAQKRANQRMRKEILPLLSRQHPRANSWNPLRSDFNGTSAYGMKLWLPDALAMEIMRSDALLQKTATIVLESTVDAALEEKEAFVKGILGQLMSA